MRHRRGSSSTSTYRTKFFEIPRRSFAFIFYLITATSPSGIWIISSVAIKSEAASPHGLAGRDDDSHGGDGGRVTTDACTIAAAPATISVLDLHAALTATAPAFMAYTMRATAAPLFNVRAYMHMLDCSIFVRSTCICSTRAPELAPP